MPPITQPVLDSLFSALLTNDKSSLAEIGQKRAAECSGIRAILSTENHGGIDLDSSLGLQGNGNVTPFFSGPISCRHSLQGKARL